MVKITASESNKTEVLKSLPQILDVMIELKSSSTNGPVNGAQYVELITTRNKKGREAYSKQRLFPMKL